MTLKIGGRWKCAMVFAIVAYPIGELRLYRARVQGKRILPILKFKVSMSKAELVEAWVKS